MPSRAQESGHVPGEQPAVAVEVAPGPLPGDTAGLDWSALRERVAACTRCELHSTRTQTVFGVGSPTARWMFIGEAPGAEEDRQGEPFVGRAGQLLTSMLKALGLARDDVYIANVLEVPAAWQSRPASRRGALLP